MAANRKTTKKPVNKKAPRAILPSAKEPERPYREIEQIGANRSYYPGNHGTLYLVEEGKVLTEFSRKFWVKEVSRGWGTTGSTETSRRYSRYYAQGFDYKPIKVTAQFRTDEDLQDFAEFVKVTQIRSAGGNPMSKLSIPSAGIQVFGYIPEIEVGAEAQGFLQAPEVQFDFQVTKDKSLNEASDYSQQIIAYYLDPKDGYWASQRISEVGGLTDIDSDTQAAIDSMAEALDKSARLLVKKKQSITKKFSQGSTGVLAAVLDIPGEVAKNIARISGLIKN
jgi:hypothetical protein